jgi:murein tripeptide amidase MpaA
MVPVCIADRLVTGYERDARIQRVIDAARFFIIPIVNPDGYDYTWTTDRYWRKNRRGGYGVDLNRKNGKFRFVSRRSNE